MRVAIRSKECVEEVVLGRGVNTLACKRSGVLLRRLFASATGRMAELQGDEARADY